VAYTLIGGFVVVVRLSRALPDIQSHLISLQVQLDILGSEREGEMPKEPIDLFQIINRHEQLYMNEVILGTCFGIILGPHALGIFDPRSWTQVTDTLTREIMRIVLATGLFAIGVELPKRYMADHAKSLLIMVVPTMAFGWLVSAGKWASALTGSHASLTAFSLLQAFIHVLFPKLDFVSSLVISACLTPTDPIISAAVIGPYLRSLMVLDIHSGVLTSKVADLP
jgi:NhaP-type Na+/H+ or K+/H+ antiporter